MTLTNPVAVVEKSNKRGNDCKVIDERKQFNPSQQIIIGRHKLCKKIRQ